MLNLDVAEGTGYLDDEDPAVVAAAAVGMRRAFNAGIIWGVDYHEDTDGPEARELAFEAFVISEIIAIMGGAL